MHYNTKNKWINSNFALRYVPSLFSWNFFEGFENVPKKPSLVAHEAFVATLFTAESKKIVGSPDLGENWSNLYSAYRNIGALSFGYFNRLNNRICFATFLKYKKSTSEKWDSEFKLGMDFLFPLFTFRALVNSSGTVSSFFEDLTNEGGKLSFSAKVNYFKSVYKFGFGLAFQF